MFWDAESGFAARRRATAQIDSLRERAMNHLEAQVPDPALREALTPLTRSAASAYCSPTTTTQP